MGYDIQVLPLCHYGGLVRREGFELTLEPELALLLLLPQLQLLLYHHMLPLSGGRRLCVEGLLLLDGGVGMSLSCGIQLLGVMQQLLSLGIKLVSHCLPSTIQDLHHVEVFLPRLHLLLLRGHLLLEQGEPHQEAQSLLSMSSLSQ
jgi:hypothetical protein